MVKRFRITYFHENQRDDKAIFIKQIALSLGLKGFYRKMNDTIQIEVEGKHNAIEEFLIWLQKDPGILSFTIETFDDLKGYSTMEINIV